MRDKDEKELSEELEVDGQGPRVEMELPRAWRAGGKKRKRWRWGLDFIPATRRRPSAVLIREDGEGDLIVGELCASGKAS